MPLLVYEMPRMRMQLCDCNMPLCKSKFGHKYSVRQRIRHRMEAERERQRQAATELNRNRVAGTLSAAGSQGSGSDIDAAVGSHQSMQNYASALNADVQNDIPGSVVEVGHMHESQADMSAVAIGARLQESLQNPRLMDAFLMHLTQALRLATFGGKQFAERLWRVITMARQIGFTEAQPPDQQSERTRLRALPTYGQALRNWKSDYGTFRWHDVYDVCLDAADVHKVYSAGDRSSTRCGKPTCPVIRYTEGAELGVIARYNYVENVSLTHVQRLVVGELTQQVTGQIHAWDTTGASHHNIQDSQCDCCV